jgi:hypothetical protein
MKSVSEIVVPLDSDNDLQDLTENLKMSLRSLSYLLNVAYIGRFEIGTPTDRTGELIAIDEYVHYLEAVAATIYELHDEELSAADNSTARVKDGGDPS